MNHFHIKYQTLLGLGRRALTSHRIVLNRSFRQGDVANDLDTAALHEEIFYIWIGGGRGRWICQEQLIATGINNFDKFGVLRAKIYHKKASEEFSPSCKF
jgi:hypothetical protein